jgi:hypothetical protein
MFFFYVVVLYTAYDVGSFNGVSLKWCRVTTSEEKFKFFSFYSSYNGVFTAYDRYLCIIT